MFLSSLKNQFGIEVIRSASFETLGFLSDPQDKMLTFLEEKQNLPLLKTVSSVCVIAKSELAEELNHIQGLIVAKNPKLAFFLIHNHLSQKQFYFKNAPSKISKKAKIHPSAQIAKLNVEIGEGCEIGENVVIRERSWIGKDVKIMAGAVLGSVGLQVSRFGGEVVEMIHAGGVRVEDDACIMSNAVIASAVFRQSTVIGAGSRIGNLVFVSHNAQIGSRSFIGHGSIINGNVKIGEDAWVGPGSVISNNIDIGKKARVCLGSTVVNDVLEGQRVIGPIAAEKTGRVKK